jgi:porin
LLHLALRLPARTETPIPAASPAESAGRDPAAYTSLAQEPDDLRQELDRDAVALSRVPADPVLATDPFGIFFDPFERLTDWINKSARLKIGETYTFVSQYATATPDGVRHDQTSGRGDFTAAWKVYDHGSNAGTISLLADRERTSASASNSILAKASAPDLPSIVCREGDRKSRSR